MELGDNLQAHLNLSSPLRSERGANEPWQKGHLPWQGVVEKTVYPLWLTRMKQDMEPNHYESGGGGARPSRTSISWIPLEVSKPQHQKWWLFRGCLWPKLTRLFWLGGREHGQQQTVKVRFFGNITTTSSSSSSTSSSVDQSTPESQESACRPINSRGVPGGGAKGALPPQTYTGRPKLKS